MFHDFPNFEDAVSRKKDRKKSEIEPKIEALLSGAFTEESWQQLEALIGENVEFDYYEKSRDTTGGDYAGEFTTTDEKRTWAGPIFDHQDILTVLHKLNNKNKGENVSSLYPYMKKCLEKLLTYKNVKGLFEEDTGRTCANIQGCIAMALKKQDYKLVKQLFSDPRFTTLPLLSAVTLDGQSDNLLHYYLLQLGKTSALLNAFYVNNLGFPYQEELTGESVPAQAKWRPKLPNEILNIIHSENPEAGNCGILLLSRYTQYHLRQLTEGLNKLKGYHTEKNQASVKKHFLAGMMAYCQWRRLMMTADFAENSAMQAWDSNICKDFKNCFMALPDNTESLGKLLKIEDFKVDFVRDIKKFCDNAMYPSNVTKQIIKEMSQGFQGFEAAQTAKMNEVSRAQQERKQAEEDRKKAYLDDREIFVKHTRTCLNDLCENFSGDMTIKKWGKVKPLGKIKLITIEDDGQSLNFNNTDELGEYIIKKINTNDSLPLSDKLRRITDILLQTINKIMELPQHKGKFFYKESITTNKIQEKLKKFAENMQGAVPQFSENYDSDQKGLKTTINSLHLDHTKKYDKKEKSKNMQLFGINNIVDILREHEKEPRLVVTAGPAAPSVTPSKK